MSTTATRLVTLITLLQRRPKQKVADLAEQLGVSVRTIHRYINMLDDSGIPVYSERGPHGGFSLVRGYRMPPLVFTPHEAVAVYLGTSLVEEIWGQLYPDAARSVTAKLDNVLPDVQRHEVTWARRSLVATGMHRAHHTSLAPLLDKLRRAARQRRRITMVYQGRSHRFPMQREIDPYALVHRWGCWYVVGHCCLRDVMRTFRVDRIQDLALRDEIYTVPDDIDIHQYLDQESWFPPQIQVRMLFSPLAAVEALEEPAYWDTCEEQPDGSLEVTFGASDLDWAVRVALGFCPRVMHVDEALSFFQNAPAINRILQTLADVGLGYVKLGQSATTLSGGEAQRVKLAKELARVSTGDTVYILDEPTTGLHFADIQNLLNILHRLTDAGNTVIVIENNLDVIKTADSIIDLGLEGGDAGGHVVAEGTPEAVARIDESHTGQFGEYLAKPVREGTCPGHHSVGAQDPHRITKRSNT